MRAYSWRVRPKASSFSRWPISVAPENDGLMTGCCTAVRALSYSRPIIVKAFSPMSESALLAAIDLGSNSFRLLIARTTGNGVTPSVRAIDSVKRSVRLAAGLDTERRLDAESRMRGLEALSVFSDRLRAFAPQAVRAVALHVGIAEQRRRTSPD